MEKEDSYCACAENAWMRWVSGGKPFTALDWAYVDAWEMGGVPLQAVIEAFYECGTRYKAKFSRDRIRGAQYFEQKIFTLAEELNEIRRNDDAQKGFSS